MASARFPSQLGGLPVPLPRSRGPSNRPTRLHVPANDNRPGAGRPSLPGNPPKPVKLKGRLRGLGGLLPSVIKEVFGDPADNLSMIGSLGYNQRAADAMSASTTYPRIVGSWGSPARFTQGDVSTWHYAPVNTVVRRAVGNTYPDTPAGYPISSFGVPDGNTLTVYEYSQAYNFFGTLSRDYHAYYFQQGGFKKYVLPDPFPEGYFPGKILPVIDPLSVPVGMPLPDIDPLPYPLIPRQQPNPDRSPREQSHRGNGLPDTVGRVVLPGSGPRSLPGGRGVPAVVVDTRPPPSRPPPKDDKERKRFVGFPTGAVRRLVDSITEAIDALNALYYSLPKKRWQKNATPQDKIETIAKYIDEVSITQFLKNLAIQEVSDAVIGRVNRRVTKLAIDSGANHSYTGGPAL